MRHPTPEPVDEKRLLAESSRAMGGDEGKELQAYYRAKLKQIEDDGYEDLVATMAREKAAEALGQGGHDGDHGRAQRDVQAKVRRASKVVSRQDDAVLSRVAMPEPGQPTRPVRARPEPGEVQPGRCPCGRKLEPYAGAGRPRKECLICHPFRGKTPGPGFPKDLLAERRNLEKQIKRLDAEIARLGGRP